MHRQPQTTWKGLAAAVALVLVSGTANAQAPVTARPANAPRGAPAAASEDPPLSGPIDVVQSRVYIKVGKVGFSHEHAVEGRVTSGLIRLGADAAAGQLVFDLKTFVADTAEAREYVGLKGETDAATAKKVTANMLAPEVLHAAKYPQATFQINSARPQADDGDGGNIYLLDGAFTLHGVTKPLQVQAAATRVGDRVNLSGKFSVLQTDYGIRPYSRALGAVKVADRLEIFGEIVLQTNKATDRNEQVQQKLAPRP